MKWLVCASIIFFGCNDGRNDVKNNGKPDLSVGNMTLPDLAEPPLIIGDGGPTSDDAGSITHDPVTCAEAATSKSYIGCDYWPTVNLNPVWSVFDYAVVISNTGMTDAHITITGGALPTPSPTPVPITQTVPAGQLVKIGLPWVVALKGPDSNASGQAPTYTNSVLAVKGAYHLTSDLPVLVYQFNALEYKAGAGNDLNGKAWSTCPVSGTSCKSYSNDASLLLPSTAMTGNYIVTGVHGDDLKSGGSTMGVDGPHLVVTATQDNTMVTVKLGAKATVLKSTDNKVAAGASGSKATYTLNAGDVLQLLAGQTGTGSDLSGSQVQADKPVQVISGIGCMSNPQVNPCVPLIGCNYSCDHTEESQLPAETWGKNYVLASVTGPGAKPAAQTVRIYGGANAAALTYTPAVAGAPAMIAAYGVAEFDAANSFVVTGDHEFAVGVIQKSGEIVDSMSSDPKGDPSLSFISAVEQYRDKYIFLAPSDYDENYADVVVPTGTSLTLDGAPVTATPTAIGGGYGVIRLQLMIGTSNGSHVLTGSAPFGLQVEGYGAQTSYQYPAGLDLKVIASPPPPIS